MSSEIKKRINAINKRIVEATEKAGRNRSSVKLITVTKTHSAPTLQEVLDAGALDIGENRVQEVVEKIPQLRGKKIVHLIGHLQSNKVNKIVGLVDWIHSADTEKIINRIDQRCAKLAKKINILIQVNTSKEDSKAGCKPEETEKLCKLAASCNNINFRGLMTIGPLHGTAEEVRKSFKILKNLGDKVLHLTKENLELSMGMSGDFEMAISEGATMIRVGSLILGDREYK